MRKFNILKKQEFKSPFLKKELKCSSLIKTFRQTCKTQNIATKKHKIYYILCFLCFVAFSYYKDGGERWIRTTEVVDNRFTVCSLWPLGNLSVWSWWLDSNPQPADYKSAALPIELHQRIQLWVWCLGTESNHRHRDFQSLALPTELPRQIIA